jgi:hypothetical protein
MLTQIFQFGGTLLMIFFSGLAVNSLWRAISLAGEANRTILNIRKRELVSQARWQTLAVVVWAIAALIANGSLPLGVEVAKCTLAQFDPALASSIGVAQAPATATPLPNTAPDLASVATSGSEAVAQLPATATPEATATEFLPTATATPPFPVLATLGYPIAYITPVVSNAQPKEGVIMSFIRFGSKINDDYTLQDESEYFELPFLQEIKEISGVFTYSSMTRRTEWSVVWYRDDLLLWVETFAWDGPETGYGFVEFNPEKYGQTWESGYYTVQLYLAGTLMSESFFTVVSPAVAP